MHLVHRTIDPLGAQHFRPRVIVALLALIVVLAGACGDDTDSAASPTTTAPVSTSGAGEHGPDLTRLAPLISCGDAVIVFATPDDTTVVRVQVPDLLALAEEAAGPLDLVFDLADPTTEASVVLEQGTGLATTACNDVPDPDYEVTDTWTADTGTVTLTVTEVPDGPLEACVTPIDVVVATQDVAFPLDSGSSTMPDLTHTGLVGWCAG